jgi:hypothetical protein
MSRRNPVKGRGLATSYEALNPETAQLGGRYTELDLPVATGHFLPPTGANRVM